MYHMLFARTYRVLLVCTCLALLATYLFVVQRNVVAVEDISNEGIPCHTVRTPLDVVSGQYAPPFSFFGDRDTVLVRARCVSDGVQVQVGSGAQNQFIYEYAYERKLGGVYKRLNLRGGVKSGEWYIGTAYATLSSKDAAAGRVLVYLCERVGSEWKCGCKDSLCTHPAWMLQTYQVPNIPVGISESPQVPVITSISPTMITSATQDITVYGKHFGTHNTVLLSSDFPDTYTNIPSENGVTITFTSHSVLANELRTIFEPLQGGSEYSLIVQAFTDSIEGRVPGYTDAVLPLTLAVKNEWGQSEPATVLLNVSKLIEEIN